MYAAMEQIIPLSVYMETRRCATPPAVKSENFRTLLTHDENFSNIKRKFFRHSCISACVYASKETESDGKLSHTERFWFVIHNILQETK